MFHNVLIALKEDSDHDALLDLAKRAAPAPATFDLVTLVRVGTNEEEFERLKKSQARLDRSAERLRTGGYDVTSDVRLIVLAAGADLVQIANDRECDLIVIGLAKRTRVGKALMGSDAQRVLLSGECPVLVTRLY